jgi:hypothetical protein
MAEKYRKMEMYIELFFLPKNSWNIFLPEKKHVGTGHNMSIFEKKWFPAIFANDDIPPLNGDRIMIALALHRARERSPERIAGVSVPSSSKIAWKWSMMS